MSKASGKSSIESILEALADGAVDAAHLFAAIHGAGYGASRKAIERRMQEMERKSIPPSRRGTLRREKHSFYSFLSYLKKDGLVEKRGEKWSITVTGKRKLRKLQNRLDRKYKPEQSENLHIVIFDIPEKERWKRDWLRDALMTLGFKLVQRSVWAGKRKIPRGFLEDLRRYNMLSYVDIFTVTRTGSLRSLKHGH